MRGKQTQTYAKYSQAHNTLGTLQLPKKSLTNLAIRKTGKTENTTTAATLLSCPISDIACSTQLTTRVQGKKPRTFQIPCVFCLHKTAVAFLSDLHIQAMHQATFGKEGEVRLNGL